MSNRTNGSVVRQFEQAFAQYVGAQYGIACCNGTATLHTALAVLEAQTGVCVPPLTMASTTLAVLHTGGTPLFVDVDQRTWLMQDEPITPIAVPVALYGLHVPDGTPLQVLDAAETLNPHDASYGFTSYSFQASKILALGEGGMLVTDDEDLYLKAMEFSRLGYPLIMRNHAFTRIDDLKRADAERHYCIGHNYRMNDLTAAEGLRQLDRADALLAARAYSAKCYRQAVAGCAWLTPQYVPEGWPHSYWTFAVAADSRERADALQAAIVKHGGELCYRAWRVTYQEPAFRHLAPDGACPVAEDLQPRILQLQTNHDRLGAECAAEVLHSAIQAVA